MKDKDTRNILQTFSELKGKEKAQYFVDYILVWVLLIIVAIVAVVWIDFEEDGQKHPVGIKLSKGNKFFDACGLYDDDVVVGVVVGCPQDANAKEFVQSVLRGVLY